MGKLSVILVVLDKHMLEEALAALNFNNAQLEAVIIDGGNGQSFVIGNIRFTAYSISDIDKFLKRPDEFIWLLNCSSAKVGNIWRVAKFLLACDVPRDNIVNFIIGAHISQPWIGNLRYVESHPVDYIATGISYTEVGLDLDRITDLRGVNLAGSNQDLRQAYLTAHYVFERQQSIKFVLIGLAPYSFRYDNLEAFSVSSRNLQYLLALKNFRDDSVHGQLLRMLISNQVKRIFTSTTEADADPNYAYLKTLFDKNLPANTLVNWELELKNLTKEFRAETFEKNLNYLEQYIRLCLERGARPIGIVLPFSPIIYRKYPRDLLSMFRRVLAQLHKAYGFETIDLFDFPLGYKHFYNLSHLNPKGARLTGIRINYELWRRGVKSVESMCRMNYEDINELAFMLDKHRFTDFMTRVFECSAEKLRRKDKIKVGFVLYDASMWCGDELYRQFERSERYEPTVFLCLRRDQTDQPTVVSDFRHGVDQFRARNINIVAVDDESVEVPQQDLIFYMTVYAYAFTRPFLLENVSLETLIMYIPYGIGASFKPNMFNSAVRLAAWKVFLQTEEYRKLVTEEARVTLPGRLVSGHPKIDALYSTEPPAFEWKLARSDAVKIIWAPHWTINSGIRYATFQWNFEFFYEYAKAHPETSWVLKPHPNLLFSAVDEKVFPDAAAFEDYLNRWNALPNAKVVTGGYYFDIFKTSDAMILDSGSFIAEYQYTHKPLLFLTRDTQHFDRMIAQLMPALYCADGRDFDGIEHFIDDVVINRNDPMASARQKFFDEHLDYVKRNGMSASEFIFKTIDRELGGAVNG